MPAMSTPKPTAALSLSTRSGVVATKQGLTIRKELGYEDWKRLGVDLKDLSAASPWMIGDWLAYGHEHYTKTHWGNRLPDGLYKQISDAIGLSESTLANIKYIAQALPPSRRRDGLTMAHAQEIIGRLKGKPEEQDKWIAAVVSTDMSVKSLRVQLRAQQAKTPTEVNDRGTPSALETARQFVRDFSVVGESLSPAGAQEVLRILAPVLQRLTRK